MRAKVTQFPRNCKYTAILFGIWCIKRISQEFRARLFNIIAILEVYFLILQLKQLIYALL